MGRLLGSWVSWTQASFASKVGGDGIEKYTQTHEWIDYDESRKVGRN